MNEFDLDNVQDSLEQLCRDHKMINHEQDGQRSFARLQTGEHMAEIKNNGGPNIVVVAQYAWRRVGDKDDQQRRREVVIRVACYASKDEDPVTAKKNALKTAERIVDDICSRIEKIQQDDNDNDVCGAWQYLEPENINCEEIEDQPWFLNHYGFDLMLPFKTLAPAYNADNWR